MGGMGETLAALFIPLAIFVLAVWGNAELVVQKPDTFKMGIDLV